MDKILEEVKKVLGDKFEYSVGTETVIMTWSGKGTVAQIAIAAELWVRDAPWECVSVAINTESVSLMFKRGKE